MEVNMADPESNTVVRTCKKHGEHSDWSIRKPHGKHKSPELRCRHCDRDHYAATRNSAWRQRARAKYRDRVALERGSSREQYRGVQYRRLCDAYGDEIGARYLAATVATLRNVSVARVLQDVVSEAHPGWTLKLVRRVIALNRLAGMPLTSVGWLCAVCHVRSDEASFFDIDHIIARSELRKQFGNARARKYRASVFAEEKDNNLQILCPNCHKCKTLGIASWFESDRDAE